MLPAIDDPAELTRNVGSARDLAVLRLIEAQSPDGSWSAPIHFNAMPAAIFVIMLRTTGLIARPGQMPVEASLLRRFPHYQNPDGGFWKYEGSASSPLLTQICRAAVRLALGEVPAIRHPAGSLQKNPVLDPALEAELRALLARCESFLAGGLPGHSGGTEWDLHLLAPLLTAHACGMGAVSPWQSWRLRFVATALRMPGLLGITRWGLHRLAEAGWPPLMILTARLLSPTGSQAKIHRLASRIRISQDETGGWELGSLITMLNVMALVAAGTSLDDPAIGKAHGWLAREFLNGRSFAPARSRCCNTGYALDSLLRTGASLDAPSPAAKALDYLLGAQTRDGGYCFGSRIERDAEADSVAHVLRSFPTAATRCDEPTGKRLNAARKRGAAFMLARQHSRGGFSCYKRSRLDGHRGSSGLLEQAFFDLPTPDVSARILETLVDGSLAPDHPTARKTLGFLLRTQCANGAWWSRWWAGYLVGTSFVLRAHAKIGLEFSAPPRSDALLRRSHAGMLRAVEFLLRHQNPDGGWGETTAADADIAQAGIGPSTPLHTAHLASSLLRIGFPSDAPAILQAMRFLLATMSPDARWSDRQATFTFFARSAYYRCDFLNLVLPLDALQDYLAACGDSD